jgi:hypothetical protein
MLVAAVLTAIGFFVCLFMAGQGIRCPAARAGTGT